MSDNFNNQDEELPVDTPRKRKPKIITVYGANKKELDRVAFFEVNEDHPEGEAYVVNDGEAVEVAETAAVKRAIAEGRLTTEKVNWNSKKPPKKRSVNVPQIAAPEQTPPAPVPAPTPAVLNRGGRPGGK